MPESLAICRPWALFEAWFSGWSATKRVSRRLRVDVAACARGVHARWGSREAPREPPAGMRPLGLSALWLPALQCTWADRGAKLRLCRPSHRVLTPPALSLVVAATCGCV